MSTINKDKCKQYLQYQSCWDKVVVKPATLTNANNTYLNTYQYMFIKFCTRTKYVFIRAEACDQWPAYL